MISLPLPSLLTHQPPGPDEPIQPHLCLSRPLRPLPLCPVHGHWLFGSTCARGSGPASDSPFVRGLLTGCLCHGRARLPTLQVEFLTGQISQLEDEAKAKLQYEAALEASERSRRDTESGMKAAVEENAAIRSELQALQGELEVVRRGSSKESGDLSRSLEAAELQVAELKKDLVATKAEKELLSEAIENEAAAQLAAAARGSELEDEQQQLKALLDVARSERDRLRAAATEAHQEVGKRPA